MTKKLCVSLFLLSSSFLVYAQNANYAALDSALFKQRAEYPQEDVFLQTDKQQYVTGETIWFKAWCVNDGTPSFLSRILYVDLVDASGIVVQKKMYKLDSLSSIGGDITIPDNIVSGNFSINAYSLWMLNFPDFVFRKNIFIYGKEYTLKNKTVSKPPGVKLLFFPEGGDLISSISNRMAFKAIDNNNIPVNIQGTIEDQSGKKIADFKTEHDGMGVVELDIEAGKTYTAYIPVANNTARLAFPLPKAKEEGITLKIENSNPNRLFVLLNRAEKNKELYSQVKVIAQINYQIVYAINLNLDDQQTATAISKKDLPPGIIQITVFNNKDLPLAERVAFIENYTVSAPLIHTEKLNFQPRGKNHVSFTIDNPDLTSLSCLVTTWRNNEKTLYEDNIVSSVLLTSNIRGYIHQPGYYFKDKTTTTLRHLDLLMMTHGWRRFDWKKILKNEFTKLVYPVESAMSFRGTLYKSDRKEPIKDGRVSFIIKTADSTSILAEARTTDKGEFLLSDINYMQTAMVAYMGTNKNKENLIVDVKLIPNYIDTLKRSPNTPLINLDTLNSGSLLDPSLQQQLASLLADSSVKMLGGVTVKARKISKEDSLNNAYAGGPFLMGKAIDPTTYKFYPTIWQMIQTAVPGVTVEGNPLDPTVSFNRFGGLGSEAATTDITGSSDGSITSSVLIQESGIAYFLNEVNVSKEIINTLLIDDIALIKVLKNEAAALGAAQGAIAIYTKKGVGSGRNFDKTYTQEQFAGYSVSKEFSAPLYVFDTNSSVPDNRYTLYWSGHITLAKNNTYRFPFYNNDTGSKARVVIQGIGKNGQLIFKEMVVE